MNRLNPRDERGAALVLTAVLLAALLAVSALVIDGGYGYSNRRQMQNAADASALAGARALQLVRFNGANPNTILSAVETQVQKNGSATDSTHFQCKVLTLAQSRMDPLPDPTTLTNCSSVNSAGNSGSNPNHYRNFVGVWVRSGETHDTMLGKFVNQSTQRTGATAAASVQRSVGGTGPWMVCGNASVGGPRRGYDMIDPATGLLRTDEELAQRFGIAADWPTVSFPPPDANHGSDLSNINGTWAIEIHGSQVNQKGCGLSNNWKGLIHPDELPIPELPWVVDSDNGNQVGHYKYVDTLARTDGCPPQNPSAPGTEGVTFDDCLVILPIFDQVLAGDRTRLVDTAVFRVFYSQTGTTKYYAQFVCRTTCSLRGGSSSDELTAGGIPVVKLLR